MMKPKGNYYLTVDEAKLEAQRLADKYGVRIGVFENMSVLFNEPLYSCFYLTSSGLPQGGPSYPVEKRWPLRFIAEPARHKYAFQGCWVQQW